MKICLVRHGETDWNKQGRLQGREDIPLNADGVKQVEASAVYLRQFKWDALVSSPLARAKKSTEIIAAEAGIAAIYEDAGFVERDMGEVSGLTMEERRAKYPDGKFNGMEDLEQLRDRSFGALKKYAELFSGRDFIIVSHGAAINAMLGVISNNEIGTGKTPLRNACINMLEYENKNFTILFYDKLAEEL
ncbi:phosphoglycerate mutase [Spirochaetia bacterium]|nr:phosphoglycerate mutase [Spirochaetia bacterium]